MKARFWLITACILLLACPLNAQDKITVGVAANFMVPLNEMIPLFEKESGIKVDPVFASSGKLYAQVVNGAPFDIFLSADEERPAKLFKDGLVETPFIYARGEVVLWSLDRGLCSAGSDWREVLKSEKIKKIAIANPETAPYGAAAMAALKAAGLSNALKDKFVYPQDIGQAFQYASTGSVDAGFCALSSTRTPEGMKGCTITVSEAPEVVQAACVIKASKSREAAEKFARFLLSREAMKVKEKYGYR